MTIQTATNETFQARLEADDQACCGYSTPSRVRYQLAVALQGGWRVADSSPAEQTLLDAHGFGSGRVQ